MIAALQLRASDARFGGVSGLLVDDEDRIVMASDRGTLWQARLALDLHGTVTGIEDGMALGSLPGDLEALARDSQGRILVGLEDRYAVLTVDSAAGLIGRIAVPSALRTTDASEGIEALATNGATFIALSEGDVAGFGGPGIAWWTSDGDEHVGPFPTAPGFRPTGADTADGRLYVLERSISLLGGWAARIVSVPTSMPLGSERPDALGTLRVRGLMDNFEGIAARRLDDGAVELFLVSDDNFSALQRTILLQLRLAPAVAR